MITLGQWFQNNKGKSLLVGTSDESLRGQCFVAFDSYIHDVLGLPYFYAAGAIDIWLAPGVLVNSFTRIPYSPTVVLLPGDIVVYGKPLGFDPATNTYNGHVDVVAQKGVGNNYIGYDSNWGDSKKLAQITHNDEYNQYILGILRFKGGDAMTPNDVVNLYTLALHRKPENQQAINGDTGKSFGQVSAGMLQSQEWLTLNDILLVQYPKLQALNAQASNGDSSAQIKLTQIKAILGE